MSSPSFPLSLHSPIPSSLVPTLFPPPGGKSPRELLSHHQGFIYLFRYEGDGVYLPCFSEAKTLWQPRMKVFVLILPSRQELRQKTARRFLSC